jgi:hypothetical protein
MMAAEATAFVAAAAEHCASLQRIHFKWDNSTESANVGAALVQLAQRNSATLSSVFLEGNGIFDSAQLSEMMEHLPHLTDFAVFVDGTSLDDDLICQLARRCPHLHYLTRPGPGVTDRAVRALADHCPKLSHVPLNGCLEITEAALTYLVQRCRRIELLLVSRSISPAAVARIQEAGRLARSQIQPLHVERTTY